MRDSKNISGPQIAKHRKQQGLTQLQLSKALAKRGIDIDRAGVAKIENGLRGVNDYELPAMAKILGTTVGKLLGMRTRRKR